MKRAFDSRKKAVANQYELALEDVSEGINNGWKSVEVGYGSLFPEVAEMLASDGFDVRIIIRLPDCDSSNEVSWENATSPDQKGSVTYVDETNQPTAPLKIEEHHSIDVLAPEN